jgi:hypothetical protein
LTSNSWTIAETPVACQRTLQNLDILPGLTRCYDAVQTITVAGNGTSCTVVNGGNVTLIAGQNILFLPGTFVESNGYMWGYIAPSGPFCVPPAMPAVNNVQAEPSARREQSSFKIYPNPTSGNVIIELTGEIPHETSTVDVYGIRGEKILTKVLNGEHNYGFSLSDKRSGVYFIRVITGDNSQTTKVIKQ